MLGRIRPPVQRVLALDPGRRCLKLLLAESDFGRLRIVKEELIDLHIEGLVSAAELKAHVQETLEELGGPPLALVLPQHVSISQVIDLPLVPESEVKKLIENETVKLSGVSESRVVYDFVRLEPPTKNRQQFWVTLCQEGEIRERISRIGIEQEDLCEVTTTANALLAAFRACSPLSANAILVQMGAQTTVVVVLQDGRGAFARSFQMGGDFFTRALARLRNCSEESAEALKTSTDLLNGASALPEFTAAVDGWVAELKRQLNEWFESNSQLARQVGAFEMVVSGGGFDQPGLAEYLKAKTGWHLSPWPMNRQTDSPSPAKRFEVAFGAAVQALGHSPQPVSLLPHDYRLAWQKRLGQQRVELVSLALLLLCVLLLAFGSWHAISLSHYKQALMTKVQASQEAVDENDQLTEELIAEYENLRPLFARQQNSLDTLNTLALLQQSRSNRSFWYVLLADQQSYFSQPQLISTNRPARTNLPAFPPVSSTPGAGTNTSPAKPGFIAEVCVPEEPEAARRVLSELVNDLKRQPMFAKVDSLSEDLRRNLADPKVIIPDRDFVLALDFAHTEFQPPVRSRKPPGLVPSRNPRRAPRPSSGAAVEGTEGPGQGLP